MEKRVFLAIFLSFVVLVLYQAYFAPPSPPPTKAIPPASSTVPAPSSGQPASPAASPAAPGAAPAPQAAPSAVLARDIRVETDTVTAVFTTKGAVLKHWQLKKYSSDRGGALDLVPQDIPEPFAKPFTLAVDDAN